MLLLNSWLTNIIPDGECLNALGEKKLICLHLVLASFLSITLFYSLLCENDFLIPVGLHRQKTYRTCPRHLAFCSMFLLTHSI